LQTHRGFRDTDKCIGVVWRTVLICGYPGLLVKIALMAITICLGFWRMGLLDSNMFEALNLIVFNFIASSIMT
jgi:hypothetical protein